MEEIWLIGILLYSVEYLVVWFYCKSHFSFIKVVTEFNTRETNMRPTGIISSSHNVMGMNNLQNIISGKENKVSFPNNSVVSSNGLANLNYNPDLPHHSPKQVIKIILYIWYVWFSIIFYSLNYWYLIYHFYSCFTGFQCKSR